MKLCGGGGGEEDEEFRFNFRHRQKPLSLGIRKEREACHSPENSAEVMNGGPISPLPHMSS
jgi:hypothetical protein